MELQEDYGLLSKLTPQEKQLNFGLQIDTFGGKPSQHNGLITLGYHFRNQYIGWGRVELRRGFDVLTWQRFYPMAEMPWLHRKGLGTLAHATTMCELVDRFNLHPQFEVEHNYHNLSDSRENHLQRMGLEYQEPLQSYLKKSLEYAKGKGFKFGNPF